MKITIICVGKLKEKFFKDAVDEYAKRLSRFARLEIAEVPDCKIPENASKKEELAVLEKEKAAILARIKPGSLVAAMCVEGKPYSSEELADTISSAAMHGGHITFIIGGSLGLAKEIKSLSDIKISFGRITLPHQLMRVVLTEQLYRAFKINANECYHK